MIRPHEAELLIYKCVVESQTLPAESRILFLKLSALFAKDHLATWNGLTLDSLRESLRAAGLNEYLKLIELSDITDEPDDFAVAISPPPAPSLWERLKKKMRVATRHAA